MRQLRKNQRTMYYALYDKEIPVGDDELDTVAGYKAPVKFKASLSNGNSDKEENPFGASVDYDRVINSVDMSLPITETTLLWIGIEPTFNEDGTVDPTSANYKVAAHPLDGLRNLRIAVKFRSKSAPIVDDTENSQIDNAEDIDTSSPTDNSNGSDEDDW